MADIKKLLGVRKKLRQKTPPFRRTDLFRHAKLLNNERWNKPKGRDNKIRRRKRGAQVQVGYGGPKAIRGMHGNGMWEVMIHNTNDLEGVDAKTHAIRIGATVGNRKKAEIVAEAEKLKIKVLNPAVFKLQKKTEKKDEKATEKKTETKAAEKKEAPKAEEKK